MFVLSTQVSFILEKVPEDIAMGKSSLNSCTFDLFTQLRESSKGDEES